MFDLLRNHCALNIRRTGTRVLSATLLLALACCARSALAETTAPASSAPEFRQEAASAIPFDQLTEEAQAKVGAVVSRPTIYRRLPTEMVACDGQLYLLLVRNPDIIVNIWHLMDVTDVTMDKSGPFSYTSDDKAGTLSQIELLYGTPHMHIYYATTHYDGPMFARPVNARVVLLLRTEYVRAADGSRQITSVMDAFIKIDHLTANLVARTFSPVVGKTADHNFIESFRFVARLSETAEANGPGMRQLAAKLERVEPQVRQQFADIASDVAKRAVDRSAVTPASETEGNTQSAAPLVESRATSVAANSSAPTTPIVRPAIAPPAETRNGASTAVPPRAIQLRR